MKHAGNDPPQLLNAAAFTGWLMAVLGGVASLVLRDGLLVISGSIVLTGLIIVTTAAVLHARRSGQSFFRCLWNGLKAFVQTVLDIP